MPLSPTYNPNEWEHKIMTLWREQDVGSPEVQGEMQGLDDLVAHDSVFTVIMPPPNLTGNLHAGHAFGHYLMDTLVRIHRQRGEKSLWFPGVDHAGLQMEGVINKLLKESGRDRKTVSDDEFLKITWEKANEWRQNQKKQSSVLGSTPDFSRELFTLDERATSMVEFAYKKYWQDNLLYKGSYLINWSVGLQTALSDVSGEIVYEDRVDPLISFGYDFVRVENSAPSVSEETIVKMGEYFTRHPISVSTVRPETIPGDVAVAVHPEKLREMLHNAHVDISEQEIVIQAVDSGALKIVFSLASFGLMRLPLVTSSVIDKDFGTGALKLTPAHAKVDYDLYHELVARSVLPSGYKTVILRDGTMSAEAGSLFEGKSVLEARNIAIKRLIESGNMLKVETLVSDVPAVFGDIAGVEFANVDWKYEHNVALCERTKTVIEPLVSEEFFLAFDRATSRGGKTLTEHALAGIAQTKFYPGEYRERAEKFIENIENWCISRDLTWGHKMPVWYNLDTNPSQTFFSPTVTEAVDDKGKFRPIEELFRVQSHLPVEPGNWIREKKILDTWFSSSLWPLTTLNFYTAQQKIQAVAFDINGVLLQNGVPNEIAVDFLKQITEAGIQAYYLTNSDQESFVALQQQPFFHYFTDGVKSFDTPFAKPDPRFYEYFVHKFDLDAKKIVYLDDLAENIDNAKKIGFNTIECVAGTDLFYEFDQILEQITTDFEQYYPTQVMTTAKEIFYLWIVRMIMLGEYFTGHTPFENVVITPTVLDGDGKKMSKSLGNGIQPEVEIAKYSSDVLRMSLLGGMIPDRSMRFGGKMAEALMEKQRNFGNKLWNIARFFDYQMSQGWEFEPMVPPLTLSSPNQWILEKYIDLKKTIDVATTTFEFAQVVDQLVSFLWDDFANWYVEYLKTDADSLDFGYTLFKQYIQLLSPFMPFECEVLWQEHCEAGSLLAFERLADEWGYEVDISQRFEFGHCVNLISEMRSIRGLFGIDPAAQIVVHTHSHRTEVYREYLKKVAKVDIEIVDQVDGFVVSVEESEYGVNIKSYLSDIDGEIRRSHQIYEDTQRQKKALETQLNNSLFLERADAAIITQKKQQLSEREKELGQLQKKMAFLTS